METQNIEIKEQWMPPYRRVSWGAIFAATILVLALQVVLGLLGLSFGFGSINPQTEAEPFNGLATGTAVWLAATTLVTLFVGGWIAGRLSPGISKMRGILHGASAWALASLATVYMFSAAIGGVAKFTGGAIGSLMEVVGKGAGEVVAQGAQAAKDQLLTLDLSGVQGEADKLVGDLAAGMAKNPQDAKKEIIQLIEKTYSSNGNSESVSDRTALIHFLVARGGMPRADAEYTVRQWETTVQQAKEKLAQAKGEAEARARAAGQAIANAAAKGAAWASAFLLLGLLASCLGGWVGTPSTNLSTEAMRSRKIDFASDISSAA